MEPPPTADPGQALEEFDAEFVFELRKHWPWLLGLAVALLLLYLLGPILTPFIVAAAVAYIGNPMVERLRRLGIPRTVGVALLFLLFTGLFVAVSLLLVPLLHDQVLTLLGNIPQWLEWVRTVGLPRIGVHVPPGIRFNVSGLREAVTTHWNEASNVITVVLGKVGNSTPALLAFVVNLLMIPLVAFYLLRDWNALMAAVARLIPRPLLPQATRFARETDAVLSGLVRGQLSVMAALAAVYSIGLTAIGLDIGLLVGLGAGLVSFIPYLGFISGLVVASIAMLVQTQSALPLLWVAVVFGIGQILESGVLTPMLVGDRIGLHPVAVIFAIMAGGQLFGFVGILAALPIAAVLSVVLRHARSHWMQSPLYRGRSRTPRPIMPP
jgi:predicted PurR-regulated permease PerM